MTDEELKKLLQSGIETRARISEEKRKGDLKNIVQIDLKKNKKNKPYVKVAKEIALRLIEKGITEEQFYLYDKLSSVEKAALQMVRNDSNRDTEHLKGDYVVSSFIEMEQIKKRYSSPPLKRLQLNDNQIKNILQFYNKGTSIRKISNLLGLNRGTVTKVLNKNYSNIGDIARIKEIENKINK